MIDVAHDVADCMHLREGPRDVGRDAHHEAEVGARKGTPAALRAVRARARPSRALTLGMRKPRTLPAPSASTSTGQAATRNNAGEARRAMLRSFSALSGVGGFR